MKFGPLFVAAAIAASAVGAVYWIKTTANPQSATQQAGGRRRGPATGAVPVSVAKVTQQSVPVYRDGIGNVQALNSVVVRAQVDGRLLAVNFTEGQTVKTGDALAHIDPATYKAQYDQTVAKKAQDEANLANARIDLERYVSLAKTNAGPKQQADQQAATVAQLEAQVKLDQASIDNAKAILDYTTIVSPLEGRVGLRQVDPGNIVHTSDASGIVTITQMKPIGVLFTLPQRDLEITAKALAMGNVRVEIPNSDGTRVDAVGTLKSIDNQIDVTTGTIKVKALFPNDDMKLWPGQFVGVRVVVAVMADVKVVPATAIRRGVNGAETFNFVYTVDADNVAHIKKLDVPLQDEKIAVVAGDIDLGQSVVTEGFSQLADGRTVQIAPGTAPADAAARPARGGAGRSKDGKDQSSTQAPNQSSGQAAPAGDGRERKRQDGGAPAAKTSGDAPAAGAETKADGEKKGRRRRDEASAAAPDGAVGKEGVAKEARP